MAHAPDRPPSPGEHLAQTVGKKLADPKTWPPLLAGAALLYAILTRKKKAFVVAVVLGIALVVAGIDPEELDFDVEEELDLADELDDEGFDTVDSDAEADTEDAGDESEESEQTEESEATEESAETGDESST